MEDGDKMDDEAAAAGGGWVGRLVGRSSVGSSIACLSITGAST